MEQTRHKIDLSFEIKILIFMIYQEFQLLNYGDLILRNIFPVRERFFFFFIFLHCGEKNMYSPGLLSSKVEPCDTNLLTAGVLDSGIRPSLAGEIKPAEVIITLAISRKGW